MTTNNPMTTNNLGFDPLDVPLEFDAYDHADVHERHYILAKRLAKPGEEILPTLTPEKAHLLHMAVGVCSEAGELLDAVKKHVFYNQSLNMENVVEELGDLAFYEQGLRQGIGVTEDLIKIHNIVKLEKRYGKTYSDEAAKERRDKNG